MRQCLQLDPVRGRQPPPPRVPRAARTSGRRPAPPRSRAEHPRPQPSSPAAGRHWRCGPRGGPGPARLRHRAPAAVPARDPDAGPAVSAGRQAAPALANHDSDDGPLQDAAVSAAQITARRCGTPGRPSHSGVAPESRKPAQLARGAPAPAAPAGRCGRRQQQRRDRIVPASPPPRPALRAAQRPPEPPAAAAAAPPEPDPGPGAGRLLTPTP